MIDSFGSNSLLRNNLSLSGSAKKVVASIAVTTLCIFISSVFFFSQSVFAQNSLVVRKVDTSGLTNQNTTRVDLTVIAPSESTLTSDNVSVTENGKKVNDVSVTSLSSTDQNVGTVFVLDTSEGMKNNDALRKVKDAAKEMLNYKNSKEQYGLVVTNGTGRLISGLTSNAQEIADSIEEQQASNQNALWNAISIARDVFYNTPNVQPNIVVVTANPDQASQKNAFETARSSVRSSKAMFFAVGLRDRGIPDSKNLQNIANATGGRYAETNDPSNIKQILVDYEKQIANQALISYASSGEKVLNIVISLGDGQNGFVSASINTTAGTISEGSSVFDVRISKDESPSFLEGKKGLFFVALVTLFAIATLIYGLVQIFMREGQSLSRALRPYLDEDKNEEAERDLSRLADSQIIKKALDATTKAAKDHGIFDVLEKRLECASLPLRPGEALFMTGLITVIGVVAGLVLKGILGALAAAVVCLATPYVATGFLAKRRQKKFTSQLPDTLQLLSGSLRAGYSLVQALDAVSKQASAPMSDELVRAMSEARLGRPVEEALGEMATRMQSEDFEWSVMAIKIQREVGGNLAELLVTVSETMIARERLRREVSALTAEGRISAIILALLPIGLGITLGVMNPVYMEPLTKTTIGHFLLGGSLGMIFLGYWVMMKMIKIEA